MLFSPQPQTPENKSPNPRLRLLAAIAVIVVLLIAASNCGGDSDAGSNTSPTRSAPTKPVDAVLTSQQRAATIDVSAKPSALDPVDYQRLSEADFKSVMYPSGNLASYPYPHEGRKILIYGSVEEMPPVQPQEGARYFVADMSHHDEFWFYLWELDMREAAVFASPADLPDLQVGDHVEIYAEVRRPYLTGETVFGHALRDPFLMAHSVRVIDN